MSDDDAGPAGDMPACIRWLLDPDGSRAFEGFDPPPRGPFGRAFRVKPPAWTDSSAGVCAREYHTAKGHGCSLVVVLASKGWRWAVYTRRDGGDGGGVCESLEHGKRLAEAWYVAEVTRNMEEVR